MKMLSEMKRLLLELKFTLIGEDGLDNISDLIQLARHEGVHGAFVETGVWRGGACIWARGIMDHFDLQGTVYVCDSFKGLPPPTHQYDVGDTHHTRKELAVSLAAVKENFGYFDLKGEVKYVEGLFKDTMPELAKTIEPICILRLDGDMYDSTMPVLEALYDKVLPNGYVIIDDYCLPGAKSAADHYRQRHNITSPIVRVNDAIHFWKKEA